MNLRERCEKLAFDLIGETFGVSDTDKIESFAREIRAEALEEAVNEVGYWPTCEATRKAICALVNITDAHAPEAAGK